MIPFVPVSSFSWIQFKKRRPAICSRTINRLLWCSRNEPNKQSSFPSLIDHDSLYLKADRLLCIIGDCMYILISCMDQQLLIISQEVCIFCNFHGTSLYHHLLFSYIGATSNYHSVFYEDLCRMYTNRVDICNDNCFSKILSFS